MRLRFSQPIQEKGAIDAESALGALGRIRANNAIPVSSVRGGCRGD